MGYESKLGVVAVTDYQSSHVLIIVIVAAFSVYFYYANSKQRMGKKLIEGTVDSLHLRSKQLLLTLYIGGFPVHLLMRKTAASFYDFELSKRLNHHFPALVSALSWYRFR